ncbi:uncharacterized protein OGAPODRAFT_10659 [Ogataea polymorpha]|uniref:uncharacterized protein n=1 Tax=Ogataea polymorpha TaxID=460523 RepID=UPI0007F3FFB7|nr:uncharacterized protein OGAPODRAFT_10659 [Ogataea polymorpha]OBA14022.1 hypothetical protein OGAPODRAFT_10659 [Ogataea polymorpha]
MEDLRSLDLTKARCDGVKHLLIPFVPVAEPTPPYVSALASDTLFQIVAIRDVSRSAISYIESLVELIDANEGFYDRQTKSRPRKQKVIRSANVDGDAQEHWPTQAASPTYRLTLQDAHGNFCYAHEIEPLPFLRSSPDLYPVRLGSKLLVQKDTTVMRRTTPHEPRLIPS